MVKNIKKIILGVIKYILANILAIFFYDRKYLKGKYFEGKYNGIFAIGWEWAFRDCVGRILFGYNKGIPFPVSPKIQFGNYKDIEFNINDLNNFQGQGNYFQTYSGGKIIIGKGTYIANNVGLITENHSILDPDKHEQPKNIILGEKCWIGMNSMILPGVELGPHTTVGAGAVVTKSFVEGYCVLAGNPAKIIKRIKV